jgi:hypothetical protein
MPSIVAGCLSLRPSSLSIDKQRKLRDVNRIGALKATTDNLSGVAGGDVASQIANQQRHRDFATEILRSHAEAEPV